MTKPITHEQAEAAPYCSDPARVADYLAAALAWREAAIPAIRRAIADVECDIDNGVVTESDEELRDACLALLEGIPDDA